jgi:hypothetical protein
MINNNNDMSINDLAGIIKEGFDNVDKRFEQVDKRFEQVESRLCNLERSMEEVKLKFAYVAWAIDLEEFKKRVIELEKRFDEKQQ